MIHPLVAWGIGMLAGVLLGALTPKLRRKVQGFVKLHFVDLDIDIIKYGKPESVTVGEKEFVINYQMIKKHTAYFDTRFAEQLNFVPEPDFSKWKYYISSKTAHTTLQNKVLQQLMLIQESNFIKIILFATIVCIILTGINLYLTKEMNTNIEIIFNSVAELKKAVIVG